MPAIMHHTPLLQQSASAALRACAKRQRPGAEHAHSSTFIDLWPHQRCVSASLPNPLNLASDRQHAPRAAAEVCQSAWPLGGPQSWSSGLGTCCQAGKSADLNDAMKLVDNVIRRYYSTISPPIQAVRACHFVKSPKLLFTHPTKPVNTINALPIGEKAAHVFVNVSYLISILVPVGTLYANNKRQQCYADVCCILNAIQTPDVIFDRNIWSLCCEVW